MKPQLENTTFLDFLPMGSISPPPATTLNTNEIILEIPFLARVYKNGTIERLQNSPIVPPTLQDPITGVSSKDVIISENPPISARLYLPKSIQSDQNKKVPILVYFHGGGFFFESAFNELHHKYFNLFVSETNVLVVSVEYRLAPEVPLPAAYEDCWDALKWVATKVEPWVKKYGDFNRVFIGGDSAGGNIVHHIALRVGQETLPSDVKVYGAFLSQPYFYGSKPIKGEPVLGHEQRVPFLVWALVCPYGPGGGHDDPMINPFVVGAPSLDGLGCSKILVCTSEKCVLRERAILYCEAVKKSGWQGELDFFEVEEEEHAFHFHNPESENASKMFKRFADFLLQ